jgi:hypothetical protein
MERLTEDNASDHAKISSPGRWEPPPEGWLKANVDRFFLSLKQVWRPWVRLSEITEETPLSLQVTFCRTIKHRGSRDDGAARRCMHCCRLGQMPGDHRE